MNLTREQRKRIKEISNKLTPSDIECLILSISNYTCIPGVKTKNCNNHCIECWIDFLENLNIRKTRDY